MPHFESAPVSSAEWYRRAKTKIKGFLQDLDPTLRVSVESVTVTPPNSEQRYDTWVLRFTSTSNPELNWTMEIEESDEYIETRFEATVRKIYQERMHTPGTS